MTDYVAAWLAQGRALVPVTPGSRVPAMRDWVASPIRTAEDAARWSGHSWGWALGSGDLVIDVDPRNGGADGLRRLNTLAGGALFRQFPTVRTPRGGFHLYVRIPEGLRPRKSLPGWKGVDWLSAGAYVMMPGQRSEYGEYIPVPGSLDVAVAVPPAPAWLLGILTADAPTAATERRGDVLTRSQLAGCLSQLPVGEFREHGDWLEIMQACHDATAGDGLEEFVAWSTADPHYADAAGEIAYRWKSLTAGRAGNVTAGTLLGAVLDRGGSIPRPTAGEMLADLPDVPEDVPDSVGEAAGPPAVSDAAAEVAAIVRATEWRDGHVMHAADQRFWTFCGTHWTPLADNLVEAVLARAATTWKELNPKSKKGLPALMAGGKKMLEAGLASAEALHSVDASRQILNVRNGEIHMTPEGGVWLQDHDPRSRMTTCLPVEYHEGAQCPMFDRFLLDLFSPVNHDTGEARPITDADAMVSYMWELIGYSIQPIKDVATWVLLTGAGANGKSTLINIVMALLGPHAASVQVGDLADTAHGTSILPGKLLVVDEDLDQNYRLPDGFLKKVSENKPMMANPKFQHPFSFENTAIIWMASNSIPLTRDLTTGMMRRAHVVPFMRHFRDHEQDHGLARKIIKAELPGVLAGALRGLQRLRMRGRFDLPRTVAGAVASWAERTNAVAAWMAERLDPDKRQATTRLSDAYADYRQWSRDTGHDRTTSRQGFRQALQDRGIRVRKSGTAETIRGGLMPIELPDMEDVIPF